jgi:hypothetical protein
MVASPKGLGPEKDCAGEDQQHLRLWLAELVTGPEESLPSREGVTSSSHAPILVEDKAPFQNT